jgi:hypothetical protein
MKTWAVVNKKGKVCHRWGELMIYQSKARALDQVIPCLGETVKEVTIKIKTK